MTHYPDTESMVLVQGSVVLAQTTSFAFMHTTERDGQKNMHFFTASPLIPSSDPSLPVLSTPPPLVLMSQARYNYKAPKVLSSHRKNTLAATQKIKLDWPEYK